MFRPNIFPQHLNQKNVFNFVYSKPFHTKFRDSQSYFGFPSQLSKQFKKVHKVLARLVSTEQSWSLSFILHFISDFWIYYGGCHHLENTNLAKKQSDLHFEKSWQLRNLCSIISIFLWKKSNTIEKISHFTMYFKTPSNVIVETGCHKSASWTLIMYLP